MELKGGEANESEATSSQIDREIMRLKRELVADDAKGHSCDQCRYFKVKPIPSTPIYIKRNRDEKHAEPFFKIDTTEKEIQDFAASGCTFWIMIRDQIAYIALEARVKQESKKVEYDDPGKCFPQESGTHFQALAAAAASVGGSEETEFWRLHRHRGVRWLLANANARLSYAIDRPDFVRVSMEYSDNNNFDDIAVTVDVNVVVPRPQRGDEITLYEYQTRFLVMTIPRDLADTTRNCLTAPINLAPESLSMMNLMKHWIRKCEVEHNCGIGHPPLSMPSMILDVSDRAKVRLMEVPATMRERYITLSYCWGKTTQTVMLNQESKATLLLGISPQQLDPTIRDSVTVARELGFRFLWVDALCIPQDGDGKFKARELGKMGDIYRNATFTIAASAAKDVREGFLTRRAPTLERVAPPAEGQSPCVFQVEMEGGGEQTGGTMPPVILRPDELDKVESWYSRAWTLQELLFSRRRLQYRAKQTTWVCYGAESMAQESDGWVGGNGHTYHNYSDGEIFSRVMALLLRRTRTSGGGSSSSPHLISQIRMDWYDLMAHYSQRKLRYPTDRLPAISGIAKEFASVLEDEYVCGLWKSDLASGLLWRRAGKPPLYPSDHKEKPRPSWSWAGFQSPVYWSFYGRHFVGVRRNENFQVLDCQVDLATPDAIFGHVKGARLHVRGVLKPIPIPEKVFYRARVKLEGLQVKIVLDYDDDPRLEPDAEPKLGLLLVMNHDHAAWGIVVLVEENEKECSRVGAFYLDIKGSMQEDRYWDQNEVDNKSSHKTGKELEECRAQMRSLWGGVENIRSIELI